MANYPPMRVSNTSGHCGVSQNKRNGLWYAYYWDAKNRKSVFLGKGYEVFSDAVARRIEWEKSSLAANDKK
jgi:hypothetical protein